MPLENLQALDAVIDHKQLLTRCLNNIDFAERMLTLYEDQGSRELSDLEKALQSGDLDIVRRIAHRLAGASANAAAFGVQAHATELRHAADGGALDKTSQCLGTLQQEWRRFKSARAGELHLQAASSSTLSGDND